MADKEKKKGLKGYYITTFLIGLGFFTMGLMDPLYDTYIPIFLNRFLDRQSLVGMVMSLDNLLAIFMIPIFSAISDRTHTRIGRRMPYIVTFLPLTAIFFFIIPFTALKSLWLLIVCIFFLNIFKQAVRGPVVALMPDIVPADLRSEANGVINTMGGLATILGTILLARLMNVYITLPGGNRVNNILAFPVAAIFVVVATILLFLFVKEPKHDRLEVEEKEKSEPILKSIKAIFTEKEKSALFILLSLLCWFIAYQGILPFIGQYSVEVLNTSSGTASLAAGMVGVAYAIFAVPSGKFAHRFGRRKAIRGSLLLLVIVLAFVALHGFALSRNDGDISAFWLYSFWGLLFLFGIFWVTVVTNSFPMLWQMADYETMGIYTGVYYFFSQLAAIISPTFAGAVIDAFGYPALFLYGLVFMLIAFILMDHVHRGEPVDD